MPYSILVPLLPLLAALIAVAGGTGSKHPRAKIGALPMVVAFFGAAATLVLVASQGPVSVRFYGADNPAFPIGFYIDRLSAVMMTLITLVGTIIYAYSTRYMYQDAGYSRYLGLIAFTTFVLLCMVSSANLVMLFVCWQLLSWLLFLRFVSLPKVALHQS